jgi:glycosyltransferase involved in cell wall biosynthesis
MRICLIYDCLFPWTIGGAERWYRNVAERLASEGHEVTYLTRRQWDRGDPPAIPGVRVVAVSPRSELYTGGGRRTVAAPLLFGLGVFGYLAARGRRFDVVHTASFPYFSLLAAGLLRPVLRYRLVVDWHEVWTREYWTEYLGAVPGAVGAAVQRLCARFPQQAFCFSRLHARRLREDEQLRGPVVVLEGEYAGPGARGEIVDAQPHVLLAARLIPEKRAELLIEAMALLRRRAPELRCEIYGDGPEREKLEALARSSGVQDVVTFHGFVDHGALDEAMRRALCVVLPSRREGYGMVVVEASACGVPSVVVAAHDNAATELIAPGENGLVVDAPEAAGLAQAILDVRGSGPALRHSTRAWYLANERRLALDTSLDTVTAAYGSS